MDRKLIELVYGQQPKRKIGRRCPSCGAEALADTRCCLTAAHYLKCMQLLGEFNRIKQILGHTLKHKMILSQEI